ncbi:MAG: glucose-1-phosphate adenylyltransferase [Coprobacillus sp.]|nr:glucose-1-phosphate adenylyltransferase [Coprobacillus sp.]
MTNSLIAVVLAGGKGTRLYQLTKRIAKPAVQFAAKYRLIDFSLSNCVNSGINTIGVLTQYESTFLNSYIGNGEKWGLNGLHSLMTAIAPKQTDEGANWYKGTADAIAQNIEWIDSMYPENVLILSGDHIYKTTFNDMFWRHTTNDADVTISVIEVDPTEAPRFGIMVADENDHITEFQEKPKNPKSNLASMGIYMFKWKTLRKLLIEDMKDENSTHDFGNDIIPKMLERNMKVFCYRYNGYWRDVGTIPSLHAANMDIIDGKFNLNSIRDDDRIYTQDTYSLPHYVGKRGTSITSSIANQGAVILGKVNYCVISNEVMIDYDSVCDHCVIMSDVHIGKNSKVRNAIIAPGVWIGDNVSINQKGNEIILVADNVDSQEVK